MGIGHTRAPYGLLVDDSAGDAAIRAALTLATSTKEDKVSFFREQLDAALAETGVPCECGNSYPLRSMYRCLYCGIWFCERCAEIHFGKTKAQYRAEHPEEFESALEVAP